MSSPSTAPPGPLTGQVCGAADATVMRDATKRTKKRWRVRSCIVGSAFVFEFDEEGGLSGGLFIRLWACLFFYVSLFRVG